MSNERIDLTRFESMIGGTWSIEWLHGDPENEEPEAAINTQDYGTIAQTFYRDGDKESDATTKAIGATPELIAELKRCYDLIDSANASMKQVREMVLGSTLDWDNLVFQEVVDVLLTLD